MLSREPPGHGGRASGRTRRAPVLNRVESYTRGAHVGPGRRHFEWVTVGSHTRGGSGPSATTSRDATHSRPLIVYDIRPPLMPGQECE